MNTRLISLLFSCFLLSQCSLRPAMAQEGIASWYDSKSACGPKTNNLKGCPLANGESIYALERKKEIWIASNNIPLNSKVRITNQDNLRQIVATVKDRGGFNKYGRIIDICKVGFQRLAPTSQGIIPVTIEVLK